AGQTAIVAEARPRRVGRLLLREALEAGGAELPPLHVELAERADEQPAAVARRHRGVARVVRARHAPLGAAMGELEDARASLRRMKNARFEIAEAGETDVRAVEQPLLGKGSPATRTLPARVRGAG